MRNVTSNPNERKIGRRANAIPRGSPPCDHLVSGTSQPRRVHRGRATARLPERTGGIRVAVNAPKRMPLAGDSPRRAAFFNPTIKGRE
jgi:hypothetical protein